MLAAFGLIFLAVGVPPAAFQTSALDTSLGARDEPIGEAAVRTSRVVELAANRYGIAEWNEQMESISEGLKGAPDFSFEEKSAYYTFLREATRAYDNFAEELFWCWKNQQCNISPMKKQCQFFSSLIPQLAAIDKLVSKDQFREEVDRLLGEEDDQEYVPLQVPNVVNYLTYICGYRAYPVSSPPETRPHRNE